ncbi:MAG: hypothetical protein HGB03_02860 [Candidatus Yonathbacteria bacterium]|nr:hypothetical protein [Candidatus Yonathbacteria bacterium]NTW47425.1 hypothetical protein [Candidatus Yonathbacteria bacterium]
MSGATMEILKKETYLKAVENAVGTRMFNSLFVRFSDDREAKDILNDGMYSCAFFVSAVLYLSDMLDKPYATVASLLGSLEKDTRWRQVDIGDIKAGDVIVWEKIRFDDGSENAHTGFGVTGTEAVSTDYKQKMVARHPIVSETLSRKIEAVYRYSW